MHGMHGVSGARTMPVDCGMKGMHGNTSASKTQNVDAVQSTKVEKLPGGPKVSKDTSANKIDVKI